MKNQELRPDNATQYLQGTETTPCGTKASLVNQFLDMILLLDHKHSSIQRNV